MRSKNRAGKGQVWQRLQRPAPSRPQRKAILISLEDARSARLYFEDYRRELKASRVVVIAHHQGPNPDDVVEAAKQTNDKREREAQAGRDNRFDEDWVVFDTEGPNDHDRIQKARRGIEKAKRLGFKTAVSNPCFEYWLLLHFEETTALFKDGKAVCDRLKNHIKAYSKSKSPYQPTREHVELAMKRAEKQLPEKGAGGSSNPCEVHPCTEVHRLIKSLLRERP